MFNVKASNSANVRKSSLTLAISYAHTTGQECTISKGKSAIVVVSPVVGMYVIDQERYHEIMFKESM